MRSMVAAAAGVRPVLLVVDVLRVLLRVALQLERWLVIDTTLVAVVDVAGVRSFGSVAPSWSVSFSRVAEKKGLVDSRNVSLSLDNLARIRLQHLSSVESNRSADTCGDPT